MNDAGRLEKGADTDSAKHPKGRLRLLVSDPYSGSHEHVGKALSRSG